MPHIEGADERNIVFNSFPKAEKGRDEELLARWEKIHAVRDDVKKELENARAAKVIGSSLEADLTLYATGELLDFLKSVETILPEVFIVSGLHIVNGDDGNKGETTGVGISVSKIGYGKCERCWKFDDSVGKNSEHPTLCARCAKVISE